MKTNLYPQTDTILSNQGVASLIFSNAIAQISLLAKVSQQEAMKLLNTEVRIGSQNILDNSSKAYSSAVIEQTEQKYIYSLFK
jgi:hypothetical protein